MNLVWFVVILSISTGLIGGIAIALLNNAEIQHRLDNLGRFNEITKPRKK